MILKREINMLGHIPTQIFYDPRTVVQERDYIIQKGAEQSTYRRVSSQNFSNNQVTFSVVPDSNSVFLDRKMYVSYQARVRLTATSAGVLFPVVVPPAQGSALAGKIGLRYMPITTASSNLQVQINNTNITINPRDYLEPLLRSYSKEASDTWWSVGPSMHDVSQEYNDCFNSALNPIAGNFVNAAQQPRGMFQYDILEDLIGTTYADILFSWQEPVMISPMILSKLDSEGFFSLTNFTLQYTIADINRIVSVNPAVAFGAAGLAVSVSADISPYNPVLTLQFLRPAIPQDPADKFIYPYLQMSDFITLVGNVAPGASVSASANNLQLAGVPSRMYCFVRQNNADLTPFTCDTYARINSANVLFNTQSGILANAPPYELYNMSVRNGLNYSWCEWQSTIGSVLIIDFGKDIPSQDYSAVGVMGTKNFQIQLEFTNIGSVAKNYSIFLVPVYEGILTIENGSANTMINLVTPEQAAYSPANHDNALSQDLAMHDELQGGNILTSGRNFIVKAKQIYNKGQQLYQDHKEGIDLAINTAKTLGIAAKNLLPLLLAAGLPHHEIENKLRNHGYSQLELQGLGLSGGGLSGGRLLNSSDSNRLISGSGLQKLINYPPGTKKIIPSSVRKY